jgi:hypothetical protein
MGPVGPFWSSMPSVTRTRAENSRMSWETAAHKSQELNMKSDELRDLAFQQTR